MRFPKYLLLACLLSFSAAAAEPEPSGRRLTILAVVLALIAAAFLGVIIERIFIRPMIGEELFAASAYLSGEPKQMGSLKGQDVGKGMAMVAISAGAGLLTLSSLFPNVNFFARAAELVGRLFQVN